MLTLILLWALHLHIYKVVCRKGGNIFVDFSLFVLLYNTKFAKIYIFRVFFLTKMLTLTIQIKSVFACSKSLTVYLHAARVLLYVCMQKESYCIFACSKCLTVYLHAARVLLYICMQQESYCIFPPLTISNACHVVLQIYLCRIKIYQQWPRLNF